MGDRCSVWIKFGGRISVKAAEKLIEVLNNEGFLCSADSAPACMSNLDEEFYDYEVNYANTDEINDVCATYGVDYEKTNDSGGDYGAGIERLLDGECRYFPACEGQALVSLERIIEADALVTGWAKLMEEARFMAKPFPNLVIDPSIICSIEDDEEEN